MVGQLLGILGIFLVLGIIIVVHEFGHFSVAKLSGMLVHEFSIGLGPLLAHVTRGGTQYSLRAVPFGGYVRIAGMELDDETRTPGDFHDKPFIAKFLTLLAGAGMNFVLAFVFFIIMGAVIGFPEPGNQVIIASVVPNQPADRAGLQSGDHLLTVAGHPIVNGDEVKPLLGATKPPIPITVERQGVHLTVLVTPKPQQTIGKDIYIGRLAQTDPAYIAGLRADDRVISVDGQDVSYGRQLDVLLADTATPYPVVVMRNGTTQTLTISARLTAAVPHRESFLYRAVPYYGIGIALDAQSDTWKRTSIGTAIVAGWQGVTGTIVDSVAQFASLATRRLPVKMMSGPAGIMQMSYKMSKAATTRFGLLNLVNMIAMFSIAIGFFNLLPLPALDGSHLVFEVIEAVRRKPIDRKKQAVVHLVGLAVLLSLVLLISIKDITQMVGDWGNRPAPTASQPQPGK